MPKEYVETCLCGYFLVQEEVDEGECPECGRDASSINQAWLDWEEMQIEETELEETTASQQPTS